MTPSDQVLLLDVNETLLDLSALDPLFARVFGGGGRRPAWFAQTLELALTATVIGAYRPFGQHAEAALRMLGAREGVAIGDDEVAALREGMGSLPPHPDVRPALERLRGAGLRLAALTNSTVEVGEAQLASAGLRDLLEAVLSADAVGRLKPAREAYVHAAERLGLELGAVRMVAAHDWDVRGALAAGARAAFVSRPGKVLDPLAQAPDLVVADLGELAARLAG
jgi:2-haloacid dehalogenase